MINEGNFVAVYGHLGKVSRVIAGGKCQYCQTEDESYGECKDTPC